MSCSGVELRLMLMITGPPEKKNEGVGSVTKRPGSYQDVAANMLPIGALEARMARRDLKVQTFGIRLLRPVCRKFLGPRDTRGTRQRVRVQSCSQ